MHAKCSSHVPLFVTSGTVALQAPLSMGFSSKNTGVGGHALLQGIFPTQGSNRFLFTLLHGQTGSLPQHHLGQSSITMRRFWSQCRLTMEGLFCVL